MESTTPSFRTVIKNYVCAYPEPIETAPGDPLEIGKKDCEYPGWIWVTTAKGRSGWIADSFVEIDPSDSSKGRALRDYTAAELTVEVGCRLEVIMQQSAWIYARTEDGRVGWVPLDHTQEGTD